MEKQKLIDYITDLLTEFDEMGFVPTTTVPADPEAYAIEWKGKLTKALEEYRKQEVVGANSATAPAADVVEVKRGKWSFKHPNGCYYCSCCGKGIKIKYGERAAIQWDFCPNCGAMMKGGAE